MPVPATVVVHRSRFAMIATHLHAAHPGGWAIHQAAAHLKVLKAIASELDRSSRESGILARWGGEDSCFYCRKPMKQKPSGWLSVFAAM